MNIQIRASISLKISLWLAFALIPVALSCLAALLLVDTHPGSLTKHNVSLLIIVVSAVSACSMIATWLLFLFPLGKRLKQTSNAVHQIFTGKPYSSIADTAKDELGELSRSIDRLSKSSIETSKKHEIDKQSLNHQATHDELTGLSNRKHGNETISSLDNMVDDLPTSILFLDLDGFKAVNDTCGHAIGDEILIAVSLRLKAILHKDSVLIRWGGDEFVIVLPGANQRRAISIAQDVADLFKQPISTTQGVHKLGCSIGLSTSRPNTTLDEVLQEADARMYEQKKKRKSTRQEPAKADNLESTQPIMDKAA